ncbi:MAG TPA: hypothetical protein VMD49_04300 [Steroidobacteraceae bacterium]|nr:hypothetical protein [Steroidobacteraceae bacterium]
MIHARSAACAALALLAACGAHSDRSADVVRARLVFVGPDLRTPVPALPASVLRLWCPFILGDLYGEPGTGDLAHAVLHPDLTLEIDLERSLGDLERSLEPTEFSLHFLRAEPAEARIARLAPMVLQANGIEPLGRTYWIDADTQERLMLIFADRPVRITGQDRARGLTLSYDLLIARAGYVWVRERVASTGDLSYRVTPRPTHLELAVEHPPR